MHNYTICTRSTHYNVSILRQSIYTCTTEKRQFEMSCCLSISEKLKTVLTKYMYRNKYKGAKLGTYFVSSCQP